MSEVHNDNDFYFAVINRTKYKLLYRTRIYKNINGEAVYKEKNKRIGKKTIDGKKLMLVEVTNVPLEERKQHIDEILNTKTADGRTYLEYLVDDVWDNKICKSQSNEVMDECSVTLEKLADYFLSGFEGDNILNSNSWERIKKYEVSSFEQMSFNDEDTDFTDKSQKSYDKKKMSSDEKISFKKQNFGQITRWKNSRTKKLDNIYSYDNENTVEEWICEKKIVVTPRLKVKYNRIINIEIPFDSKWCTVSVDGSFEFDNKNWLVSSKQYKCNPLMDTGFVQDKILCYKQNNEYYFFDMMIDQVKKI